MKTNRHFIPLAFLSLLLSSCTNVQDISVYSGTGRSSKPSVISHSNVESSTYDSGDSDISAEEHSPWEGLDYSHFGEQFRTELKTKILATGNKTIGYSENNAVLSRSDKALNGEPGIIPFYHDENQHTTSWNKEHVWPNSRGAGKTGCGADPQMLRPTASACNSSRGNNFYGIGSKEFDPARCAADSKNGEDFPLYEASRGEAARIIFYVAAKYGDGVNFKLTNNPGDPTSAKTMGTLRYLIQWNNQYPVTEQEKRRNDCLDKEGFSRNPFIDDRDLANYIWDEEGLRKDAYVPSAAEA